MNGLLAACGIALACAGFVSAGCESTAGRQRVSVYAASSLTEAFGALESEFEAAHPDVDVVLTFSGSQVARLQIEGGAPADVFASADLAHLQTLVDAGLAAPAQPLAQNELVVIVPLSNPAGLQTFDDLPQASRLVVGSPGVPVGAYTQRMLERAAAERGREFGADVRRRVVSQENNVRLVRAKVELGEADAAIVYRTDAVASTRVRTIPIPASCNVRGTYAISVILGGPQPALAAAFVRFALSDTGQDILTRHGFVRGAS